MGGLKQVIISIHDASPAQFLFLETNKRGLAWATRSIETQKANVVAASEAGLSVRVNTVVYHSHEQALEVLRTLEVLQKSHRFEIRLLNDLSNLAQSQQNIERIRAVLEAERTASYRKAGSSNVTVRFRTPSGFEFSTKTSFRYFLESICGSCALRPTCYEGFYGLRLERRLDDYWVRLCIYKQSSEVLMTWRQFLESESACLFAQMLLYEQQ